MLTVVAITGLVVCLLGIILSVKYQTRLQKFIKAIESFTEGLNPQKYKKIENPRKSLIKIFSVLAFAFLILLMVATSTSKDKGTESSIQKENGTDRVSGKVTYDVNGNQIVQGTSTGGIDLRQLSRIEVGRQIRYYYFVKNFNQNDPVCWAALDKKGESLASMEPDGSCVIIEFLNTEVPLMDKNKSGVLSEKSIPNVILQYARYTNGKANSQDDPYGTGNFTRKK